MMHIQNIGLMTPGDMGQAVAQQLQASGFTVYTALAQRSARSRMLAQQAVVQMLADGKTNTSR